MEGDPSVNRDDLTDDVSALVMASTRQRNPATLDIPDLSVDSIQLPFPNIGPQESMILDDPSPLPDVPADPHLEASQLALTANPLSPAAAAKPETHAELIHDLRTSVHHQTDTPITKAVLPASHSLATKVDDPCHAKYKNQTACDADTSTGGGCPWCKCAAVPSSCWTKENAKKLPSGVYTCDSLALTTKPLSPAAAAKPETHAELIHDLRTSVHPQTGTP